jgi:hypothetical protein
MENYLKIGETRKKKNHATKKILDFNTIITWAVARTCLIACKGLHQHNFDFEHFNADAERLSTKLKCRNKNHTFFVKMGEISFIIV